MAQKHQLAALLPTEAAAISPRGIGASAAHIPEGFPRTAAPPKAGRGVRSALGVLAALVIGLVIGAVTEWFPSDTIAASTSGGPWVLVSFLVALTAAGIASATARGLACMAGMAIGYYAAGTFHTLPPSSDMARFWIPVALLIGPLTGLAAGWIRSGPPLLAQIAAGGVPGVLIGESIAVRHPLEMLVGVAMMAGLLAWQTCRSASQSSAARAAAGVAVALAACLAAGALTASWYLGIVLG
jgi:Family of unknown function (DUF6518)